MFTKYAYALLWGWWESVYSKYLKTAKKLDHSENFYDNTNSDLNDLYTVHHTGYLTESVK